MRNGSYSVIGISFRESSSVNVTRGHMIVRGFDQAVMGSRYLLPDV